MAYVTPEEVRHYIEDRVPEDNIDHGDLVFSNMEIQVAMRRAARAYNSIPPLRVHSVTPDCMPADTEMFFDAVIWKLYQARLAKLFRNDMEFNAGDVDVSPEKMMIVHLTRASKEAESAFKIAASDAKETINISGGYGSLG